MTTGEGTPLSRKQKTAARRADKLIAELCSTQSGKPCDLKCLARQLGVDAAVSNPAFTNALQGEGSYISPITKNVPMAQELSLVGRRSNAALCPNGLKIPTPKPE